MAAVWSHDRLLGAFRSPSVVRILRYQKCEYPQPGGWLGKWRVSIETPERLLPRDDSSAQALGFINHDVGGFTETKLP
ncbi:hypothetical protein JMJ77_0015138 [Colletotrichum scovillei]|uniref:Uncharacterized protein n=1 Tax=Colletotrichum scovillei TaxID=1209932 RepID=A0A9P7R306_9PEZI|nr:hypothetical protein JMJ77_0015138 [Colletotrichum scovillei]KAG7056760.1 hypothetical protein JMJ78_0000550 [Colletotrichum scovillei]KAG7066686.1 hypothetical protein JMJ76_0000540 [Colletotrichum scovillei]